MASKHDVHFSSEKQNWGTPPELFAEWHKRFNFTIDAAADETNHLLPRWYGPGGDHEDALSAPWEPMQRYWLNPPYSRGLQYKFAQRAIAAAVGDGSLVVMLLPARTDTKLFHELWDRDTLKPRPWVRELHFLKGRVKFVGAEHGAPFPSMIVAMGHK
jgi:site-specific DNA-methyltransferase (adenine-specific)